MAASPVQIGETIIFDVDTSPAEDRTFDRSHNGLQCHGDRYGAAVERDLSPT